MRTVSFFSSGVRVVLEMAVLGYFFSSWARVVLLKMVEWELSELTETVLLGLVLVLEEEKDAWKP